MAKPLSSRFVGIVKQDLELFSEILMHGVCKWCGGKGYIVQVGRGGSQRIDCRPCQGTGRVDVA